ncbi:Uncharacterised protein [uncultured archaeon]|nr:Uncharacterised protein [uncultured archaeon]
MDRTLVMSHAEDLDGVGSASLLKMRYHLDSKDVFFSSYSENDLREATEAILRRSGKGSTVFVTDLATNPGTIGMLSRFVKTVKSKGGMVVWLDHHYWSDRALNDIAANCEIAIVGENSMACATDITKKYTRLTGDFVEKFTGLVHCTDLYLGFDSQPNPKWSRTASTTYSMSINYFSSASSFEKRQKGLRKVMDTISSGKFFDGGIRSAAKTYERINKERTKLLLRNMQVIDGAMAVGFSKEVDSTGACRAMIEDSGADISVLLKTDSKKASMRSEKSNIVALASAFGGGGHPHAAGFEIPKDYDISKAAGRKKLVDDITAKSRRLGLLR